VGGPAITGAWCAAAGTRPDPIVVISTNLHPFLTDRRLSVSLGRKPEVEGIVMPVVVQVREIIRCSGGDLQPIDAVLGHNGGVINCMVTGGGRMFRSAP
jgi:hypothetical protein